MVLQDASELRQAYAERKAIEEYLDEMIPNIRTLVHDTNVHNTNGHNNYHMGLSQFSSLENIARETNSVEVIIGWVRYQVGRNRPWQEKDFGTKLANALASLRQQAVEIENTLLGDTGGNVTKNRVRDIHLQLIRLYAGHLKRCVVAERGKTQRRD